LKISADYSENGNLKLIVSSNKFGKLPDFEAEFSADLNEATPQVVCIPFAENRGMYSQKSAVSVEGFLKLGEKKIDFDKSTGFLILDDHKGFYPNPMIYDWCTGAKNDDGNLVAFNLTDNQSTDPEKFNENCIWLGNNVYLLPPVKFTRPDGVNKTWIIKDRDGMVNLEFTPLVENNFLLNLLIIKSDYYGPFGKFKGYILN